MKARFVISIVLFAFLLASCGLPGAVSLAPNPSQVPLNNPILVQAPAGATNTPTPFLPLPPTATYIPTSFPTSTPTNTPTPVPDTATPTPANSEYVGRAWSDYPGPIVWPDINVPPPVGLLAQPKGQVNIMLLGSDQRQDQPGFRTDTLLLVTLNPRDGTVNVTSFPRDLYVYIPGWTVNRINTAFPRGGFETFQMTMEYNFGVRPDYYALINFWSFSQVIDSLGGVDVQVSRGLTDHRDGYGQYSVKAGTVHMDGETALWYVRSRYSSNDFDRTRRQQEVLQGMFFKLLNLNAVTRAAQLYETYRRNVTTDLSLEDILPLLPLALKLTDSENITQYYIGSSDVIDFRNSTGAAVLLPIRESVVRVMEQALNSP
jgi:polyisoprenyl-teichoic acid--peptidoglycan teichoic acid transferase